MLWWIVKTVVICVGVTQITCFVVALYEMLNLPETHDARLTLGSLIGAARDLVVEIAAMTAAVLMIPLGALPWRRVSSLIVHDRPPIVFVPGYLMTRACLWPLRRHLAHAGWAQATGYNYRTLYGDVRAAASGLGRLLDEVRAASGDRDVVVIAHGIGGIVARLCLRDRGGRGVRAVVTLGTPHQGSKLYALALDPMLAALRPGSPLVEDLGTDDPLVRRACVTTIASSFDLTIVPSAGGRYPGASTIEIEGVGHFGLLWSPRVFALVRENLDFAQTSAEASVRDEGGQTAASASTQRATSSAFE